MAMTTYDSSSFGASICTAARWKIRSRAGSVSLLDGLLVDIVNALAKKAVDEPNLQSRAEYLKSLGP
jgi:hypothetical protein